VRAVCVPRPRSPTVALQLLARAGSRDDGARPGLAHLVEHLVFRAAGDDRHDLFATVESLGGEVTAHTTRDYTAFSLVVAAPDADRALALLPALARPPAVDRVSVRGERQIVGHELRERTRSADALWDLLLAALWADDPLARPPGGSLAALPGLTGRAAAGFHARHYTAPRLLVVGVGACAPEAFADAVAAGLGALPAAAAPRPPSAPPARPAMLEASAGGGGSYVAVGVAVPGAEAADCAALRLLEGVLGQGPRSRLGRALATRGLAAAVQARYAAYAGVGVFAALAAGPFPDADAVARVLQSEIERLVTCPPTPSEVRAARRRALAALYCSCESNAGLASALGAAILPAAPQSSTQSALTAVAAVSAAQAHRVASTHLAPAAFARATLRARL
jgi:processing peptidase subunit beta